MPETHIAGLDVLWDGRYLRQRCAWCGATLLDYDLTTINVPEGQEGPPATWPVGALVRRDGCASYTVDPEPSEQGGDLSVPPEDACARLDPAVTA